MKDGFDVIPFCNSRYASNDTNMLSRIQNSFARGVNERVKLPKYVVVILDNDLIDYVSAEAGTGNMATFLGEWIEYLMNNLLELCQLQRKSLPKKTIRDEYPLIYWVAAPHHKNFHDNGARTKLNNCLDSIVKTKLGIRLIKMKEFFRKNKSMDRYHWKSGARRLPSPGRHHNR